MRRCAASLGGFACQQQRLHHKATRYGDIDSFDIDIELASMRKCDIILAQKTLAAREIKEQSKANRNGKQLNGSSSGARINKNNSSASLPSINDDKAGINRSPMNGSPALSNSLSQPTKLTTFDMAITRHEPPQESDVRNNSMNSTFSKPESGSTTPPRTDARAVDDINFFMPKKKVLRPDGASLKDVYDSKKADMWGQIIKAQYKEDLVKKVEDRKLKEQKNASYGSLLHQQVMENEARRSNELNSLNNFAALEGATAKRYEDLEKKRMEDAATRHKQFIQHAMEDIELKRRQREKELTEELRASAIMINRAKELMKQDELKKNQGKEFNKQYQERIFQENLDNIARKQKLKEMEQARDKYIIEENERQYQKEMERRAQEFNNKLTNSSEGPAHHVLRRIIELKQKQDERLFGSLEKSDNMLNKQLRASEQASLQRAQKNGESLTKEWIANSQIREMKQKEDEERNNKILSTMRAMLAQQELEDQINRKKKREAAANYQRELDAQVQAVRQRSIDNLTKTMSLEEQRYNQDLLRKSAAFL